VNINSADKQRWTPLHVASWSCRKEIVKLLLDCGADINCVSMYGKTALDLAQGLGHETIAQLIANEQQRKEWQELCNERLLVSLNRNNLMNVESMQQFVGQRK
jgi:ankyrin repeat protein